MLPSSLNWNLFGHEKKKLFKASMGRLRVPLFIYYLLKLIKTNIFNITNTTKHHEKKPNTTYTLFSKPVRTIFRYPLSGFFFEIVEQIGFSYIYRNGVPNFGT